jgi:hypothetical protein
MTYLGGAMETVLWFLFLARPLPASPFYTRVPTAFFNVWVSCSDQVTAEHTARDAIEQKQWEILRLQEWSIISRQTYKYLPASLKHFENALRNGHSLDFYLWPNEGNENKSEAA